MSRRLGPFQEFFNAGKSAISDRGAGFDGFVGAIEIVPGERLHVGADDQIGVALPGFELMLLCGAHGAGDHLKNIGGRASVAVLNADRNAENKFGSERAGGDSGNRCDQAAVGEAAGTDVDGLEQTWERATGANGVDEVAVGEDYRLTIIKVGGDDREWNAEILEMLRLEDPVNQVAEAVVAGEAEARNAPTPDVAKFEGAARGNDAGQGGAAGVGRSENAANAGAGDARNRYAMLLENLQDAEVRKTARKAAAESDADTWSNGRGAHTVLAGVVFPYHGEECQLLLCGAIGLAS